MRKITVDIFICTYKRNDSLDRCLSSFVELSRFDFVTIYVIDNDPNGSAREIVAAKFTTFHYINEKRKGISFARNNAISTGRGKFIAFVDDDEVVSEGWLSNSIKFLDENECDVMFGGVKTIYPSSVDGWIKELDAFKSPSHLHGEAIESSGAGNVFIRRGCLLESGCRFDPKFSFTGGEDSMLFRQLNKLGFKLLWNNMIWIDEYVEGNRLNEKYLLLRAYRDGQCYARSFLKVSSKVESINWLMKRVVKIPFDVLCMLTSMASFNKVKKVRSYRNFLKNIGQLSVLTGRYLKMYG